MKPYRLASLIIVLACAPSVWAQTQPAAPASRPSGARAVDNSPSSPAVLPGNGLLEHDFFYAGESRDRKMYIVRKGQVVWSYDDPAGKGEISDAVLLSNGNVLLAHQFAVKEISQDKKVLWNYDAPAGCEIHTAIPIGKDHVLFIQNGDPAMLKVVNIVTGETRKQFALPVRNPKSVHGQFRHARLTAAGTVIVAHMDLGKVCEYDADGKELWSVAAPGAWGVTPLKNGNLLIVDRSGVREVDRSGQNTWTIARADVAEYKLPNLQLAWRLSNGNTIFDNWATPPAGITDPTRLPVQALEVTPDKKVVWALRAWNAPNLGPATTIQILDEPQSLENLSFGDIK